MTIIDAGTFDWMHAFEVFFGGVGAMTTCFIGWWTFHREDKRQEDEKAEKQRDALIEAAKEAEANTEKRHRENRAAIQELADDVNRLTTVVRYIPPHRHKEASGPLTAENLDYGPKW